MTSSGNGAGGRGVDPGNGADVSPGSPVSGGGSSNGPSDETSGLRPRYEEIVVTLRLRRVGDETWREAALRYGKKHNIEEEVAETFDSYLKDGDSEAAAAFTACYDWDILDYIDDVERDDQGPPPRAEVNGPLKG